MQVSKTATPNGLVDQRLQHPRYQGAPGWARPHVPAARPVRMSALPLSAHRLHLYVGFSRPRRRVQTWPHSFSLCVCYRLSREVPSRRPSRLTGRRHIPRPFLQQQPWPCGEAEPRRRVGTGGGGADWNTGTAYTKAGSRDCTGHQTAGRPAP